MPASFGRARAGRDDDFFRPERLDFVERDFVVAKDFHVGAELAQIVIQVVGERIVIVDQQNHRFLHCSASSTAFSMARALLSVSWYSSFGIRVGDDAGAGSDENFFAFHHDGADDDAGVEIAVVAEVADGAGVKAALLRLQLADNLHGADFRRAGNGAGGESRDE